ncbi:ABC transporter ATP-binding protein [Limobrevibacterium gyesilva]|uniref:ABC transporter ATP-binding protein n=1 Tax=Limobrevibacterium gyesilva TaxID=2991712 RepID=A0AA41YKK4_9PROT|nr:ABC transporter ATP-binding protein [Limobrevibacterium gyesilva]MCW3475529.1 ABC transporter ATP-binding protein [Limobrevibacterium gyesilva]
MTLADTTAPDLSSAANTAPVLRVDDLHVHFRIPGGVMRAVDGVSFDLRRGETLGLVGESGSGKTMTSLALLRLLETPPAQIDGKAVMFEGRDLLRLPEREMTDLRGSRLSMVFQEPMTSLNPIMTIGRQIDEPLVRHLGLTAAAARARTHELLGLVGIPRPAQAATVYPHQLSGGMRQRAMIAIALACRPSVLVADEPTTALDVTIQAQILELLEQLQQEMGTAILLITHDLAVIAETAHRVAVMYAGRIVETGPVAALFAAPLHPYTEGLLRSIPRVVRTPAAELPEIPGFVPAPGTLPAGCAFAPRCAYADAACHGTRPALQPALSDREVACWKPRHG